MCKNSWTIFLKHLLTNYNWINKINLACHLSYESGFHCLAKVAQNLRLTGPLYSEIHIPYSTILNEADVCKTQGLPSSSLLGWAKWFYLAEQWAPGFPTGKAGAELGRPDRNPIKPYSWSFTQEWEENMMFLAPILSNLHLQKRRGIWLNEDVLSLNLVPPGSAVLVYTDVTSPRKTSDCHFLSIVEGVDLIKSKHSKSPLW